MSVRANVRPRMRSMSTSEGRSFTLCSVATLAHSGRMLGISLNGLCLRIPADPHKNTGSLVVVDRFSKMVHLVAVPEPINASVCVRVFTDTIHGLPRELVSDRDPRFTAEF